MDTLDLNVIPSKALNYSTRLLLGQSLNPEQQLLSKDGLARDYRGLAEQMDFQYNDIRNFQRSDNPTLKILEAWTLQAHTTIGQLVQYLENMGRHDIVQDLKPKLECDAKLYFQKNLKHNLESPLQVPEVTSCRSPDSHLDDLGILTREDANTGEYTLYDAFVCYADEDIQFVYDLVRFLESDVNGFKLFIRSRDMLAGHSEYETSMQLIQERCKRVLIILSNDFLKCPACEVQASFAAGLGFDEKCRKLIPIKYKDCEIPIMLKYISKIDFTKPCIVKDWIWKALISSLQDGPSSNFISTDRRNPQICHSMPHLQIGPPDVDNPAITYPPSTSSSASNIACYSSSSSPVVNEEIVSDSAVNVIKTSSKRKTKLQNLRFWNLPKKVDAYDNNYATSTSISLSSNATSGFHSQGSDEVSEHVVLLKKPYPQDTVM